MQARPLPPYSAPVPIRLLALDADGTVLDPDGAIRAPVRDAIVAVRERGVKVVEVTGEVEIERAAPPGEVLALLGGETIQERDRIFTGFESTARLSFADGTTIVVEELTDMKVGTYRHGAGAKGSAGR